MRSLHTSVQGWDEMLPEELEAMDTSAENIKNPLFRCVERENSRARALLGRIRKDLQDLDAVCKGEMKQTNNIRELLMFLSKGMIPKSWRAYSVPPDLSVNVFVKDFGARLEQLKELATGSSAYGKNGIILGRLFSPEAFLTASRQAAAQAKMWPLEELELEVFVPAGGEADAEMEADPQVFSVLRLNLEGAEWSDGKLAFSDRISTQLPITYFKWVNARRGEEGGCVEGRHVVDLPVYLNSARKELLFSVGLDAPGGLGDLDFAQRGIGISAHSFAEYV